MAGDLVAVADGTMYGISDHGSTDAYTSNWLITINTTTGHYISAIGQIGYGTVFGVAYAGGHIYAFTGETDGKLIEIDRATGAGTLKRTYPGISFWGAGVSPMVPVQ